jgi:hypothetical protein
LDGGVVLLLFRAAAFVACASFTAAQIVKPIIDGGSRAGAYTRPLFGSM